FTVLAYCDLLRPEPYGYTATFRGGRLVITTIDGARDSPALRAGLQRGDVVVAADGRRVDSDDDWAFVEATLTFNHPLRLTIQRGSEIHERTVVLSRAGWRFWATTAGAIL